jgi:hypothetical protein
MQVMVSRTDQRPLMLFALSVVTTVGGMLAVMVTMCAAALY